MRNTIILMTSLLVAIAATPACAEDAPAEKASKEFFDASGGRAPFSGAVRVGDTLYMSGALGTKDRKLAEGGTGPETVQALENIKARLAEHGLEMSDVVKCTVFLSDMAEFGTMNEAYMAAFAAPRPTRSALGVNGLAFNAAVEIECIAAF